MIYICFICIQTVTDKQYLKQLCYHHLISLIKVFLKNMNNNSNLVIASLRKSVDIMYETLHSTWWAT